MVEVSPQRREAAEKLKFDLHVPQRLEQQIGKAISASNALAVQEEGWSKRSEKPHGALYDGWVEEIQRAGEYASQLSFQIDLIDIAAGLQVKKYRANPLIYRDKVEGMVEGKEIEVCQNYEGDYGFHEGYIDGELIPPEDARNLWLKVGSYAVSIESEVERMNQILWPDDYDDH